ncbi:hypothetical protein BgiBS90_038318 [Biomphalaria glabrata]|nr:hypothetical protein BgiBS90_038318 [Biomphalaria glabrata]
MGSQDSVTGPYGHTFSFPYSWVVKTPSPGLMATHSFSWISWAVKTPSPGHMATHSPSPISWAVKTPSPGHMATHSPSPDIMGSQDSVTSRTVYGDTISFSEIMDNQYSVTGPYGHTFSFLDIMGSQDSVTGPYSHTLSSPEINGRQGLRH